MLELKSHSTEKLNYCLQLIDQLIFNVRDECKADIKNQRAEIEAELTLRNNKTDAICQWFAECTELAFENVPHPELGMLSSCAKHLNWVKEWTPVGK